MAGPEILIVVGWVLVAAACAKLASDKGHAAPLFFVLGLIAPVIVLIVVLVLRRRRVQVAERQIVKLVVRVDLDDGTQLRRGRTSTVHGVSVIDNTFVVSIDDEHGVRHWVAGTAVELA